MAIEEPNEPTLAEQIGKNPYRGAARPQANKLLSPSKGYWIDIDWDGDLGDLSEEEGGETTRTDRS